jgi:hypothetical protein
MMVLRALYAVAWRLDWIELDLFHIHWVLYKLLSRRPIHYKTNIYTLVYASSSLPVIYIYIYIWRTRLPDTTRRLLVPAVVVVDYDDGGADVGAGFGVMAAVDGDVGFGAVADHYLHYHYYS